MLNIPTTEERLGQSPQRLVRYFVLLMAVVYVCLGIFLWWIADKPTSGSLVHLGPTAKRILGSVFIIYGLLRFRRGISAPSRKPTPSDHE